MYEIKRGHRVIERTTTPEMAETIAKEASKNGELINITESWDDRPDTSVKDYFDGHEV